MNFDDIKFDSQEDISKLIDEIKDPYLRGKMIYRHEEVEKELSKVDYKALVVNIGGIEYLVDSISRDWLGRFSYRLVMGSDYKMNYDPHFLNYKVASKFKEYLPTNAHLFGVVDDKNMMEVL